MLHRQSSFADFKAKASDKIALTEDVKENEPRNNDSALSKHSGVLTHSVTSVGKTDANRVTGPSGGAANYTPIEVDAPVESQEDEP